MAFQTVSFVWSVLELKMGCKRQEQATAVKRKKYETQEVFGAVSMAGGSGRTKHLMKHSE